MAGTAPNGGSAEYRLREAENDIKEIRQELRGINAPVLLPSSLGSHGFLRTCVSSGATSPSAGQGEGHGNGGVPTGHPERRRHPRRRAGGPDTDAGVGPMTEHHHDHEHIRNTDKQQERELAREAERERIVLCEANNDSKKAIRDVLSLARGEPIQNVVCRPPVAEEDVFYCRALEFLQPVDCEP